MSNLNSTANSSRSKAPKITFTYSSPNSTISSTQQNNPKSAIINPAQPLQKTYPLAQNIRFTYSNPLANLNNARTPDNALPIYVRNFPTNNPIPTISIFGGNNIKPVESRIVYGFMPTVADLAGESGQKGLSLVKNIKGNNENSKGVKKTSLFDSNIKLAESRIVHGSIPQNTKMEESIVEPFKEESVRAAIELHRLSNTKKRNTINRNHQSATQ
jgi:hypothetical protein